MKLFEIFGRGVDRSTETGWRDQMVAQHAARTALQTSTGTPAVHGFWLISREGKRLAGPFSDAVKAETYKDGRPDRIPANAVVKKL